jgi:hypothetical protein
MADLIEGEWQFTHYAAMDCDQRDWQDRHNQRRSLTGS